MNPWTPERHEALFTWARQNIWFCFSNSGPPGSVIREESTTLRNHCLECVCALREIERLQAEVLHLKGQVAQLECSVETLCEERRTP